MGDMGLREQKVQKRFRFRIAFIIRAKYLVLLPIQHFSSSCCDVFWTEVWLVFIGTSGLVLPILQLASVRDLDPIPPIPPVSSHLEFFSVLMLVE